jgi:hypothetical protein
VWAGSASASAAGQSASCPDRQLSEIATTFFRITGSFELHYSSLYQKPEGDALVSNVSTATLQQNQELDKDQLEQLAILESFLTTVHHFFGQFR